MYNHAPDGYQCPFCQVARGSLDPLTQPSDVVYQDALVTAFIASHWWPKNPGHVLVIPNAHIENIYDLPPVESARIHSVARHVALAFKAVYKCDGVSTRQHNEPDGDQEVWHYHLHVFPRFGGDNLYASHRRVTTVEERRGYAERLRQHLHLQPLPMGE